MVAIFYDDNLQSMIHFILKYISMSFQTVMFDTMQTFPFHFIQKSSDFHEIENFTE